MTVIRFVKSLAYKKLTLSELASQLNSNGFRNFDGENYSDQDVQELIRPILTNNLNYSKKGFGSCGINRDQNPCGDASDY
ncbi:hypothetical protein N8Z27_00245 [Crocinitomicaceae bacterium]|jgi:hypothetical protein|nr:hypothetical protein [Crocinitomicaceae bacterium]|tara:strand:+ start:263 stop:502 length:240 start_codon:yes stop_codon:yes gene_type:complete